jgi:hypothetical protein
MVFALMGGPHVASVGMAQDHHAEMPLAPVCEACPDADTGHRGVHKAGACASAVGCGAIVVLPSSVSEFSARLAERTHTVRIKITLSEADIPLILPPPRS